jgi:hypothetical protein
MIEANWVFCHSLVNELNWGVKDHTGGLRNALSNGLIAVRPAQMKGASISSAITIITPRLAQGW